MKSFTKDKLPSNVTIAWGGFIILSASFMRQLYTLASATISKEAIAAMIWIALFSIVIILLYSARAYKRKIFTAALPLSAALMFAYSMEISEERIHIIKYGFLGFLLFRDFIKFGIPLSYKLVLLWGFFIGSIDETFQWILPYRVGDIRDIFIDTVAVILGANIRHCIWNRSN